MRDRITTKKSRKMHLKKVINWLHFSEWNNDLNPLSISKIWWEDDNNSWCNYSQMEETRNNYQSPSVWGSLQDLTSMMMRRVRNQPRITREDLVHDLTSSHITLQPKTGCPLNLSRVEPGRYLDGRPPEKTRLLLKEVLVRPEGGAHPVVCVGPNTPI